MIRDLRGPQASRNSQLCSRYRRSSTSCVAFVYRRRVSSCPYSRRRAPSETSPPRYWHVCRSRWASRITITSFLSNATICTTRTIVYASLRLRSSRVVTVVYLCLSLSLLSLLPEALSRSLPRDSVSLSLSLSSPFLSDSLSLSRLRSRLRSRSRHRECVHVWCVRAWVYMCVWVYVCVYVRVPREKVWQEMCPRDKPTSSSGI